MALRLGTGLGLARGGLGGLAIGRVLDLDMATGRDYSALSITSSSAYSAGTGPLVISDTSVANKPDGYPGGLIGARVNGSVPAWDDGGGSALSGVTWRGPLPGAIFKGVQSDSLSGWSVANSTISAAPSAIAGKTAFRITGTGSNAPPGIFKNIGAQEARSFNLLTRKSNHRYISVDFYILNGAYRYAIVDLDNGAITDASAGISAVSRPVADGYLVGISYSGATASQYALISFVSGPSGEPTTFDATGLSVDIAVPSVATTVGVRELCATAADEFTRLAETVARTVAALDASFSIMGTLDLSGGLPTSTLDIITSGADKIQVNSTGKLIITDGTLTTTSTASLSAATGQRFGFSRTAAGSTLQIGSTQEAGEAVNWSGDTVLTVGTLAPVQRWSVWQRAISTGEMSTYA